MPGKVGHYHLLTFVKEKLLETRVFSRRYSKHKSCFFHAWKSLQMRKKYKKRYPYLQIRS